MKSENAVRKSLKFIILGAMLLGLPLLGIVIKGLPVSRYLEFPPETKYITQASFSWKAFVVYALFILALTMPILLRGIRAFRQAGTRSKRRFCFPWWGWIGVLTGFITWILAWTRFSWFKLLQPHTFLPLWLSFIIVISGLTYRNKGKCMMLDRPFFSLTLFPVSAAFWWFFEYLNRFVQNWNYVGVHFGAWEYFWYATLSFSTVLPAVLGTREWLLTSAWIEKGFEKFFPLSLSQTGTAAWSVLAVSGAGLACIGVWPDYLFALLWISPLLIIISIQALMGERHVLSDIAEGDWRLVVSSALAALLCGLFWEMWNFYSLAKWEYSVPFVHRYQVFEMPVLGYAGYLPFGLEIAALTDMLDNRAGRWGL